MATTDEYFPRSSLLRTSLVDGSRDGHDSADKKHEIAAPHYSPAASPLIPALFDEASAVGGGAQLSPLSGPGTPVDGFEASAARGVVGAWVSPSAPPQVAHYLQSLLTSATPPPPSVELVRAAAARDPRTGLCRWETWITPAAPAAAQEGLSAWLLGRAAPPTLPSPSPWSIGSARAAQGGRPLHEAWRATHSPAKRCGPHLSADDAALGAACLWELLSADEILLAAVPPLATSPWQRTRYRPPRYAGWYRLMHL